MGDANEPDRPQSISNGSSCGNGHQGNATVVSASSCLDITSTWACMPNFCGFCAEVCQRDPNLGCDIEARTALVKEQLTALAVLNNRLGENFKNLFPAITRAEELECLPGVELAKL